MTNHPWVELFNRQTAKCTPNGMHPPIGLHLIIEDQEGKQHKVVTTNQRDGLGKSFVVFVEKAAASNDLSFGYKDVVRWKFDEDFFVDQLLLNDIQEYLNVAKT